VLRVELRLRLITTSTTTTTATNHYCYVARRVARSMRIEGSLGRGPGLYSALVSDCEEEMNPSAARWVRRKGVG
jgi:hypothetical protein